MYEGPSLRAGLSKVDFTFYLTSALCRDFDQRERWFRDVRVSNLENQFVNHYPRDCVDKIFEVMVSLFEVIKPQCSLRYKLEVMRRKLKG